MNRLRIFMVGFGTVGQGFAELLLAKHTLLQETIGVDLQVVGIADLKFGTVVQNEGLPLKTLLENVQNKQTFAQAGLQEENRSVDRLINELDYDVFIELTPTNLQTGEPALTFIRQALESKHHVITTNKGPCALELLNLEQLAKTQGRLFKYEGSVLAGTPLLNLIEHNLAGLTIQKIEGIVNGTCNYILTRMEEGLSYDRALKEAQELGYAEANPEADVEGWDAVAKLLILAQAVFKTKIQTHQVERKGISGLTLEDVANAQKENKTWKLIASLERQNGRLKAVVKPQKIENEHPLAGVKGATNAVTLTTDYLQKVTIMGPGAGKHETGYAVLNDLIAIARQIH